MNRHVRFSNPKHFNDPWDCPPYFDVKSIGDQASRAKWRTLIEQWLEELPPNRKSVLVGQLGPDWHLNDSFMVATINKISATVSALNSERWRIYCLTPHADSLLMWSHYADKHKGICLEFDVGQELIGRAYRVLYKDSLDQLGPDIFDEPRLMANAVLLSKSAEWSYEDEYRILARDGTTDPAFSIKAEGDYLPLPDNMLTAVIAGCNADAGAIQAVINEHAPEIPLKLAVRRPHEYHLDVDKAPTRL